MIKPIGVYGSKSEIVRLLRSLNGVNEDMCVIAFCFEMFLYKQALSARLLLVPTEHGNSSLGMALSSGLYVVAAGHVDPTHSHHYVIYWPEESTWDGLAPSSVCRNRAIFMR
jgi:hypothetical protein